MSSCISCCCLCLCRKRKKKYAIKKLRKGSALYEAQQITQTASGCEISIKNMKKLKSRAELERMANQSKAQKDYQLIFKLPFSSIDQITENLYLTGIGGLTRETFEEIPISLVINATYEWPNYNIEGTEFVRVPVDDELNDDISIYFDEVSDLIEEVAQNNGITLVHCMAGASRSTTLVLAYLMKYKNMTLKKAFDLVKERRETTRPNVAFFHQLIDYEKKIRGKTSVKMIPLIREGVQVVVPDFYEKEQPILFNKEIEKQILNKKQNQSNLCFKYRKRQQLDEAINQSMADD